MGHGSSSGEDNSMGKASPRLAGRPLILRFVCCSTKDFARNKQPVGDFTFLTLYIMNGCLRSLSFLMYLTIAFTSQPKPRINPFIAPMGMNQSLLHNTPAFQYVMSRDLSWTAIAVTGLRVVLQSRVPVRPESSPTLPTVTTSTHVRTSRPPTSRVCRVAAIVTKPRSAFRTPSPAVSRQPAGVPGQLQRLPIDLT